MRHPEDDVPFADECAFMVETEPYLQHLLDSKEGKQVSISTVLQFSQLHVTWVRNLDVIIIGP
jgi:hypothetical protein